MASKRIVKRGQLPPDEYNRRAPKDARRAESEVERLLKRSANGTLNLNQLRLGLRETKRVMRRMVVHYK